MNSLGCFCWDSKLSNFQETLFVQSFRHGDHAIGLELWLSFMGCSARWLSEASPADATLGVIGIHPDLSHGQILRCWAQVVSRVKFDLGTWKMSWESLSVCVPWVPFHSSFAMIFDDILQFGLDLQWIPWELTYPLPRHFWRWCSFFPRWDMLYSSLEGSRQFVASGNVTVPLEVKVQVRGIRNRRQVSISTYNVTMVSIHNGLLMVIWRLFFWHVGQGFSIKSRILRRNVEMGWNGKRDLL